MSDKSNFIIAVVVNNTEGGVLQSVHSITSSMETRKDRQHRTQRYNCAGQGVPDWRRKYEIEGQEKWKGEEEKMRPGVEGEGGEAAQDE
jgi:hypothetical protein